MSSQVFHEKGLVVCRRMAKKSGKTDLNACVFDQVQTMGGGPISDDANIFGALFLGGIRPQKTMVLLAVKKVLWFNF